MSEIDPTVKMFELTGGMGAGKTTAGEIFGVLGAHVIDTDRVAAELQEPEGPALSPMVDILGAEILTADGSLDRDLAGRIMFSDPNLVKAINEALHPMIWDATLAKVAELSAGAIAVIEVPVPDLEHAKIMHGIVSVITSEEKAVERLVTGHRKIAPERARERIREQISNEERIAMSDFVIVNDDGLEELQANTERAFAWMQGKE
jgi:dephospho-CoA kinase